MILDYLFCLKVVTRVPIRRTRGCLKDRRRFGVGNSSQSSAVAGSVLWTRNAEVVQALEKARNGRSPELQREHGPDGARV